MSIDIETYRLKAQEAIEYVFVKEYHNSLGIPMPIVKMLLPDDARSEERRVGKECRL